MLKKKLSIQKEEHTSVALKVKWKISTGILWSQSLDKRRTAFAEASLKWALSTELQEGINEYTVSEPQNQFEMKRRKTDNFHINYLKNIGLWSWYTLTVSPLIFHHKTACFSGYPKDHLYQDEHEHLWLASSFSLWFWCHISAAK